MNQFPHKDTALAALPAWLDDNPAVCRALCARMTHETAFQAKDATGPEPLLAHFALALTAQEGELPSRVMWMPGGLHQITASHGGKPVAIWIQVGPETAVAAQQALTAHQAASPHKPFFDLDHKDEAATAWPTRFEWAATPAPGVYASVEWTKAGADAVLGKTHRAFSPGFFTDTTQTSRAKPARVTGAPLNMGGLVNNPAFKRILPFFASQPHDPMNKLQQLFALLGAIATLQKERTTLAADASKADQVKAKDGEITAKLTEADTITMAIQAEAADATGDEALKAKDAELKLVQARNTQLENERKDRLRADAQAHVKTAVARGAIAAQDTATQGTWEALIAADPTKAELLAKISGNPALSGALVQAGSRVELTEGDVIHALEAYGVEQDPVKRGALWAKDLRPRVEKGNDLVDSVQAIVRRVREGRVPIHAANTLGTLTGVLVVQRALDYLKITFPILSRISTGFSNEPVMFGQTVYTRLRGNLTAQDFVAANGYVDQDATTTDVPIVINKHKYLQLKFGVEELASTMRGLFAEQDEPMHHALGLAMVDELYGLILPANYTTETVSTLANFGRPKVIDMGTAMNGRKIASLGRTLLLNSAYFGQLAKDSAIVNLGTYQQSGIITAGTMPDIHGFKPIEAINLPATSNLVGMGLRADAMALATRAPNDYTQALPGVPATGVVQLISNPDTGITVMLVQWVDHLAGAARGRVAVMFGVAKAQTASGERLVSAASA